ncbi:coagulation factor XI [Penaeus vannamei]|uniref:Coagulation factor XI n=1 Tax=Penaeus vannamei TaxID=6689 RepID=A0A3R7LXH6_PENVA|nr:coagulation factor XI [Penaeus vannamei]
MFPVPSSPPISPAGQNVSQPPTPISARRTNEQTFPPTPNPPISPAGQTFPNPQTPHLSAGQTFPKTANVSNPLTPISTQDKRSPPNPPSQTDKRFPTPKPPNLSRRDKTFSRPSAPISPAGQTFPVPSSPPSLPQDKRFPCPLAPHLSRRTKRFGAPSPPSLPQDKRFPNPLAPPSLPQGQTLSCPSPPSLPQDKRFPCPLAPSSCSRRTNDKRSTPHLSRRTKRFPCPLAPISPAGQTFPVPCNSQVEVFPGVSYSILSPGYPSPSPPWTLCRWYFFVRDVTRRMTITCQDFSLPASSDCRGGPFSPSPLGPMGISGWWAEWLPVCTSSLGWSCCYCPKTDSAGASSSTNSTSSPPPTAYAHRPSRRNPPEVVVGEHDRTRADETASTRTLSVSRVINHESYNESVTSENDIGLVQLSSALDFAATWPDVAPACPPDALSAYDSANVTVAGWGYLSYPSNPSLPRVLQKVDVQTVPVSECMKQYKKGKVTQNMICASAPGKDACFSDSGGPLMAQQGDRWVVIGIVSFGPSACAQPGVAGVYTRVGNYLPWIIDKIGNARTCPP